MGIFILYISASPPKNQAKIFYGHKLTDRVFVRKIIR
nr:MAG TPA: hypothetical protein [Caudoviricetes sp.]